MRATPSPTPSPRPLALVLTLLLACSGDAGGGPTETETSGSSVASDSAGATSSDASAGPSGSGSGSGGEGPANDRCDAFCAAVVAAGCSSGPTLDACMLTCTTLTSSESCDALGNAYFDCVDGVEITCDAGGDPVAPSCGLQYLLAIDCAVHSNPNPDVVEPCASYCGHVQDAACPNNAPEDECSTNCLWFGASGTGCGDAWLEFLGCANAASFACVLGFAVAEGCGEPFQAYSQCIDGV
ncbi:MAG: hypothetical protein H6713_27445 [Myxococcales bacterium]|nr:hypothetical protein [Myxococcales bacterium]MCB9753694.1 hypothetical protein [Myxococcales bacterium]